jgi:hypothetical protein
MFALMMRCRAGTMTIEYNPLKWVHDMHIVTMSRHATEDEAYQVALRLLPRGHNRERISLWVCPWHERFA